MLTTLSILWELERTSKPDFEALLDLLWELASAVNRRGNRPLRMMACQCLTELEAVYPHLLSSYLGCALFFCQNERTHVCGSYAQLLLSVLTGVTEQLAWEGMQAEREFLTSFLHRYCISLAQRTLIAMTAHRTASATSPDSSSAMNESTPADQRTVLYSNSNKSILASLSFAQGIAPPHRACVLINSCVHVVGPLPAFSLPEKYQRDFLRQARFGESATVSATSASVTIPNDYSKVDYFHCNYHPFSS